MDEYGYTRFKHITMVPNGRSESGKTQMWDVVTNDGQIRLGHVGWYAPWRCYTFTPRRGADLVFEQQCLRDIAGFIDARTREHRTKQKEVPRGK